MDRRIFCFWTGDNPIPAKRLQALKSFSNTDLDVIFIDKNQLEKWLLPDYPLHPGYEFLSAIHRADYLRVYFMHHYGGGYSDIKFIKSSWETAFESLINSDKLAIGYREIGPKGVAIIPSVNYIQLILNWKKLIGNCSYIFKPYTEFTYEWISYTNQLLDSKYLQLKMYPAKVPEDCFRKKINGTYSKYPIRWSEMLGNIFHPLCLKYSRHLLYTLPKPDFKTNYDL